MSSVLKQVLERFEDTSRIVSLAQMARELDVEPDTLQGMIDYWVRKGKLRECSQCETVGCSCSGPKTCPFVMTLPRMYERVREPAQ